MQLSIDPLSIVEDYLDIGDLISASQVSKTWQAAADGAFYNLAFSWRLLNDGKIVGTRKRLISLLREKVPYLLKEIPKFTYSPVYITGLFKEIIHPEKDVILAYRALRELSHNDTIVRTYLDLLIRENYRNLKILEDMGVKPDHLISEDTLMIRACGRRYLAGFKHLCSIGGDPLKRGVDGKSCFENLFWGGTGEDEIGLKLLKEILILNPKQRHQLFMKPSGVFSPLVPTWNYSGDFLLNKPTRRYLIEHYPDVLIAKDLNGDTALHDMDDRVDERNAPLILRKYPEAIRMKNLSGETPLDNFLIKFEYAIALQARPFYRAMMRYADFSEEQIFKLLDFATKKQHLCIYEDLEISIKEDCFKYFKGEKEPLIISCFKNKFEGGAIFLWQRFAAYRNLRLKNAYNILHLAVIQDMPELLKEAMRSRPDLLEEESHSGVKPHQLAFRYSDDRFDMGMQMITAFPKLIVSCGKEGNTLLHEAVQSLSLENFKKVISLQGVKKLLKERNKLEITAMELAAWQGRAEIALYLEPLGADRSYEFKVAPRVKILSRKSYDGRKLDSGRMVLRSSKSKKRKLNKGKK